MRFFVSTEPEFLKIYRQLPKIPKRFGRLPKITKDFRRLLMTAEDFTMTSKAMKTKGVERFLMT